MRNLLNAAQMRQCDTACIRDVGIPSLVLMERAALAVADAAGRLLPPGGRVLAVAGCGNNGADAVAAARILLGRGVPAALCTVGNEARFSPDLQHQLRIAAACGLPRVSLDALGDYQLLIDGLFGVGLTRPIADPYAACIAAMNQSGLPIVAVDIPSGVNADDGQILGCAVRAACTVTFAYEKVGHWRYPGCTCCGEVLLCDIGIPAHLCPADAACRLQTEDIPALWPPRPAHAHKGTAGKVLVVAGGDGMAGAAYFAACAALRSGAGLVRVVCAPQNRTTLQLLLPEAVLCTDAFTDAAALGEALQWADSVLLGPGLGQGLESRALVARVLHQCRVPLVCDADALNALAGEPGLRAGCTAPLLYTPHMGEMARLCGCSMAELTANKEQIAREYAKQNDLVLVMKDARTLITDGTRRWWNTTGNSGMATGGMGDVLGGIIATLLAQGVEPGLAGALGACVHGCAGDAAAQALGRAALLPSDLLQALPAVVRACG